MATKYTSWKYGFSIRLTPMLLILLVGFLLRIALYDYGLPYVHNVDEPNMYVMANDFRDRMGSDWRGEWLAGYPPGYLVFEALLLDGMDHVHFLNIHTAMGTYIRGMRLVSIWLDMISLALIMQLARQLSDDRAAWLSGSIWAISAPVLFNAITALPDPATVFLCVSSAVLTWHAFRRQSVVMGLLSTLFALLAVAFKYPVAPVLLLPGMFFLLLLVKRRLQALIPAVIALAMVVGTAYLLLVVYGGTNLSNREAQAARYALFDNLTSVERWQNTLNALIGMMGPVVVGLMIIASGVWLYRSFQTRKLQNPFIMLTILTGFLVLLPVPVYIGSEVTYPVRYVYPVAVLLLPAGAALIFKQLSCGWKRVPGLVVTGSIIAVAMLTLLPATLTQHQRLQGVYTYRLLQEWVEGNIPAESPLIVSDGHLHRTLNRYEGGYDGYNFYPVYLATDARLDVPWQGDFNDFDYAIIQEPYLETWPRVDAWKDTDEMLLIKQFGGEELKGERIYIYDTESMPVLQTTFQSGNFAVNLHSYSVRQYENHLEVASYWQSESAVPVELSYALHLTPSDGVMPVAQQDGSLGHRPTWTWDDPQELIRGNMTDLTLPDALQPGDYMLWLIVYYWETGERLQLPDGTERLALLSFAIPDTEGDD